jgi:poly(ADP-ribose) glycohydrolase
MCFIYHYNCSISLDPEEDLEEPDLFVGFVNYLENELSATEREHIFTKTIPRIVNQAKTLKIYKPPQGLHFSLQQQGTQFFFNHK